MIEKQTATVYYSSKANRRYFSKQASIEAEARNMIFEKYPKTPFERDTGAGFHIAYDEPETYERMLRSLIYKIKKSC